MPLPHLPLPADLIDVSAVARMLGTHVSAVYRYIHGGKLVAYRIGGRWRVSRGDALAFVKRTGPEVKTTGGVPRISHQDALAVLRRAGIVRE